MRLSQETHNLYNNYLLESLDFDGFDLPKAKTNKDLINLFFGVFNSEMGYSISRIGEYKALVEYLSGLPSCINIDFDNHSIIERAKKYGSLIDNASESDEDKLLNNYWHFMANKLIVLKNGFNYKDLLKKAV